MAVFLRILAGAALAAVLATPASAYWQFIERPAGAEVMPSPRYGTQKQCEGALKQAEVRLKKKYPNRYPLIGSCEQFN